MLSFCECPSVIIEYRAGNCEGINRRALRPRDFGMKLGVILQGRSVHVRVVRSASRRASPGGGSARDERKEVENDEFIRSRACGGTQCSAFTRRAFFLDLLRI